ncbi:MAG: 3-deoxy-manno-octulosonate cytidylyltransferase [Porphyromonas sp.]|nr:3-deoxy-manno-octulosonate cytidylyltransferase [Porphyromonas sp.]
MKTIAIIPARIGSQRLPRKPLRLLGDLPIVVHVYNRASRYVDIAIVATDSQEIVDVVEAHGGKAVLTSPDHKSGTDRCLEAYKKSGFVADVIINVQGDEPFVTKEHLELLSSAFQEPRTEIATLCIDLAKEGNVSDLAQNPNVVKVVRDLSDNALYFSRLPIPYSRNEEGRIASDLSGVYYKHLGMYAYRPEALEAVCGLPQSPYESIEMLEQLRWLQNGFRIVCRETDIPTIGIDTEEDLETAWRVLAESIG